MMRIRDLMVRIAAPLRPAPFVLLCGILVACGLNAAARAASDLSGVDMHAPPVGIQRDHDAHRYTVFLLGTSRLVDLEAEASGARRAWLRASLVARDCARRTAAAARRTADTAGRVRLRVWTWLKGLHGRSREG